MRCLLINPWAGEVFPPPSLGYLQATLKRETDWEVTGKDLTDITEADIDETARVIRQNSIGRKGTNILWVLPQTEAYLRAKLRGFDDSAYLYKGAPYYTDEQDIGTLTKWNNKINMA